MEIYLGVIHLPKVAVNGNICECQMTTARSGKVVVVGFCVIVLTKNIVLLGNNAPL